MRKLATLVLASTVLVLGSSARAATPSEGVPLEVRRGFFTETDIGGFFTLGGDNAYSNFQGYLQLGVGYQLTVNNGAGLVPIGVHFGIGANAQNCWAGLLANGNCSLSDNFTMTFLNVTAAYLFRVVERLYIGPKLLAGVTLLDPEPVAGKTVAPDFGAALSLEYATNMDHFSIGIDVAYKAVIAGPLISAFAIYPRVQYTF